MTTPTTSAPSPQTPAAPAHGGQFVWHDLMTPDPAAAQAFYSAVLGWELQRSNGAMEYTMFVASGAPRGGFMMLPENLEQQGVPAHWLAYVGSEDVDESVRRAEGLGARVVVHPQDIPETGRFAVLRDPQGAAFAMYTSRTALLDSHEMAPLGDASWHELWTSDVNAAYTFYTQLFGWEGAGEFDMGEIMGPYRMFGRRGLPLGGMAKLGPDMDNVPPNWLPYFRVSDVHDIVKRVKSNGGSVIAGPMEVPGGDVVAQCMDPQQGAFAVHQVKG